LAARTALAFKQKSRRRVHLRREFNFFQQDNPTRREQGLK
jgi:hypothetical protein